MPKPSDKNGRGASGFGLYVLGRKTKMDYVEEIRRMIADALELEERCGENPPIVNNLRWLYRRLEPSEQEEFRAAVVKLLGHPDSRVRAVLTSVCFFLKNTEARSALVNMLRDEEFVREYGTLVVRALDHAAAREAGALLLKIIQRFRGLPSVWGRRSPLCEESLRALARGNAVAAAPYLRPLFDDEMGNGFTVLSMGAKNYGFRNVIVDILCGIIAEYGQDGVDLMKECFKGVPTEREAYLRKILEYTRDRLSEADWYDEEPPRVPEGVVSSLQEYIDSLNTETWYRPPVLPQRSEDDGVP